MNMSEPANPSILQPPWSGMTLPGLLTGAARLRASALFATDPEAVESLAHRPPRRLTCQGLLEAADSFARQMWGLGLKQGDVVILHLPNTVEAIIALLGVQIAGGTPALVPVFEDIGRLSESIELTSAAAIVTLGEFAGLHPVEKCRAAAFHSLSVRFVAAFGSQVPAGVASLSESAALDGDRPRIDPPAGFSTAMITFDAPRGERRALLRTHEQVVADAAAVAGLSRLTMGSRLLSTSPPMSAAGVALGIALPLLTGAVVDLNPLFDSCSFAGQLGDGEATTVILPGASELAFRQFSEERGMSCEGLILLHRPEPEVSDVRVPEAGHVRCVDVLCLGESLIVAAQRGGERDLGRFSARRLHPVQGVLAGEQPLHAFALVDGELHLDGPMKPDTMPARRDGAIRTGFTATQQAGAFALGASPGRIVTAA